MFILTYTYNGPYLPDIDLRPGTRNEFHFSALNAKEVYERWRSRSDVSNVTLDMYESGKTTRLYPAPSSTLPAAQ